MYTKKPQLISKLLIISNHILFNTYIINIIIGGWINAIRLFSIKHLSMSNYRNNTPSQTVMNSNNPPLSSYTLFLNTTADDTDHHLGSKKWNNNKSNNNKGIMCSHKYTLLETIKKNQKKRFSFSFLTICYEI